MHREAPWNSGASAWSTSAVLVPGWNSINVTVAQFQVVAGQPFTIGVHGPFHNIFPPAVGISYDDQYPAGALYMNGALSTPTNDMNFRTYVIPE